MPPSAILRVYSFVDNLSTRLKQDGSDVIHMYDLRMCIEANFLPIQVPILFVSQQSNPQHPLRNRVRL